MQNIAWPVIILCFFSHACSVPDRNEVQWPHGVKYEVFVMSYADGDDESGTNRARINYKRLGKPPGTAQTSRSDLTGNR